MKRLIFTLVLLATMFAIPVYAAGGGSWKMHTTNIDWHTSLAAYTYSYGDSFDIYRGVQTGETTLPCDTSQTIDLRKYILPSGLPWPISAVGDTLAWLRLAIFPIASTPTVAADTCHLQIQVSQNLITWHSVVFTSPISPIQATMLAAAVLDPGTSSGVFVFPIRQLLDGISLGVFSTVIKTGAAPLEYQLYGWPYMRIIIQGDFSGRYDAELTGLIPVEP